MYFVYFEAINIRDAWRTVLTSNSWNLRITKSIPWLLVPSPLAPTNQQQSVCWTCKFPGSFSSTRKDFNCLCHVSGKFHTTKINICCVKMDITATTERFRFWHCGCRRFCLSPFVVSPLTFIANVMGYIVAMYNDNLFASSIIAGLTRNMVFELMFSPLLVFIVHLLQGSYTLGI